MEFETPDEAISAVQTLNGAELAGRRISVREDREDRDVKQFIEGEGDGGTGGAGHEVAPRPARGRGRGRGRATRPVVEGDPSGFQVCVGAQSISESIRQLHQGIAALPGAGTAAP